MEKSSIVHGLKLFFEVSVVLCSDIWASHFKLVILCTSFKNWLIGLLRINIPNIDVYVYEYDIPVPIYILGEQSDMRSVGLHEWQWDVSQVSDGLVNLKLQLMLVNTRIFWPLGMEKDSNFQKSSQVQDCRIFLVWLRSGKDLNVRCNTIQYRCKNCSNREELTWY